METEEIRTLREKLRELQIELGGPYKSDWECCGLTLAQCHTLLAIGKRGEVSLIELAGHLGLDTSTLSRAINGLVLIGLVNRLPDREDRRYVSISLSGQGRKVYAEIDGKFNAYFKDIMKNIPLKKRKAVLENLDRFVDAVKAFNKTRSCCSENEAPDVKNGRRNLEKHP